MKEIIIEIPEGEYEWWEGKSMAFPVKVDWFPQLTDNQLMTNACAIATNREIPFPDPNFIKVILKITGG